MINHIEEKHGNTICQKYLRNECTFRRCFYRHDIQNAPNSAGLIILNYPEYMRAYYKHLLSKQSKTQSYYTQVDQLEVDISKKKIDDVMKEAFEKNIISKDDFDGMNASDKDPGRFYCNFKVHKPHSPNQVPPERPIVSESGSITKGVATFVNHHIKHFGTSHGTYIQDTPDFLRIINDINKGHKLEKNVIIETMDAISLFTNII